MKWAKEGRLRIPDFQRPLQWTAQDKRHLLDSMERGYPVGTLLLWKRSATTELEGRPLPGAEQTPSQGDVYLIVDGQQRVSALWEALGGTPNPREPQMLFDFESERFQLRPLTARGQARVLPLGNKDVPPLPLSAALDATNLSEWMPAGLDRLLRWIVVTPDMHRVLVGEMGLLTDAQFNASIAIAQAAPGPNVLFVAVMGYQAAGLAGAAATMAGIMLPSTTLALAAARWSHARRDWRAVRAFKAGMAPLVIALMFATGWILTAQTPGWRHVLLTIAAALLAWRTRIHLLWMIGAGAVIGGMGWL